LTAKPQWFLTVRDMNVRNTTIAATSNMTITIIATTAMRKPTEKKQQLGSESRSSWPVGATVTALPDAHENEKARFFVLTGLLIGLELELTPPHKTFVLLLHEW